MKKCFTSLSLPLLSAFTLLWLTPQTASSQTTHDVTMESAGPGFVFNPSTLTIQQGDIVRWTNNSIASHTTTSGSLCSASGLWNSGLLSPAASFSRTFNEAPGTIPYFCIPHCLGGMTASITIEVATGVDDPENPPAFTLSQNTPNPFALETTIEYEVKSDTRVEIRVFDLKGRLVEVVENTPRSAGRYVARWDGRDTYGRRMATGVYFYQMLIDGTAVQMRKLVLLR